MKDPKLNFYNNNKPKDLTEEEIKALMKNIFQDQEVNKYVYRKHALKKNLNKTFAII